MSWRELAIIPITIFIIGGFLLWEFIDHPDETVEVRRPVPDFAAIKDVKVKKQTFFDFMLPLVRDANDEIRRERQTLLRLRDNLVKNRQLNEEDLETVRDLIQKYRAKIDEPYDAGDLDRPLRRVDTIPASLALAQAANESAWGTARFARNGNNYYGIWCWSKNCGLVPRQRGDGETHEVTAFASIGDSVSYYMLTLNSHPAYDSLRLIRSTLRNNKAPVRGYDLAQGLLMYSERREAYVQEIRAMIEGNNLRRFTRLDYDI